MRPAHHWLSRKSRHYRRWHLRPHATRVHWAVATLSFIISAALVLNVFVQAIPRTLAVDVTVSTNTTWSENTYNYGDITVNNGANLTIAGGSTVNATGIITVTGNSTITIASKNNTAQVGGVWAGVGSTINAANISIASGSKITANGQGYTAGYGTSAGNGPGAGGGAIGSYSYGAGGSYGGAGGPGNGGAVAGAVYGASDAFAPIALGSGGGGGTCNPNSSGTAGGGAIRLSITGTLTLSGTISADGGSTTNTGGAGSGGSVYIVAGVLTGSGAITATGGNFSIGSSDGGGGRMAVYYGSRNTDTTTHTANGIGSSAAGTVKFSALPTTNLTSPTASQMGVATSPSLQISVDDYDNRTDIKAEIEYVSHADIDCSDVSWAGSTTVESANNGSWTGTGTYDVSAGAQSVTYSGASLIGHTYYCWRGASKSSATGDYTSYGSWSTAQSFYTNTTPEVQTVAASQQANGSVNVTYEYKDTDNDTLNIGVMYRQSASGWALNEGGTLTAGDTTITLNDASRLPSSGTILIDNEEISYTGKSTNDLTGCIRGANSTAAITHTDATAVYFKASTLTGDVSKSATGTFQSGSLTWIAPTDYSGYYDSAGIVRVTVNDTYGSGYAGANTSATAIDVKAPDSTSLMINTNATYSIDNDVILTLTASDDNTKKMRFSNNNSTWSDWEDYAVSKAWDLANVTYGGTSAEGVKTVYAEFKDSFENTASTVNDSIIYDITPPNVVNNLFAADSSNPDISKYLITLTWDPITAIANPDFSQYILERSVNSGEYAQLATFNNIDTDYYVDKNLSEGSIYHYRIAAEDLAGNHAAYSSIVDLEPNGEDQAPPIITGDVPSVDQEDTSAAISWVTNEAADSYVEFGTTTSYGYVQGTADLVTNHSVTIIGLSSQVTYHFRVRSRDAAGNTGVSPDYSFTTNLPAEAGTFPLISSMQVQQPGSSENSAVITWSTDKYSTSQVLYGLTSGLGSETATDLSLNKNHYIILTGLLAATTYYYKVKSVDVYGNVTIGDLQSFTTAGDVTGPTLNGITSLVGATGSTAQITWTTNEVATSAVYYDTVSRGIYTAYTYSQVSGSYDTNHLVNLSSLSPGNTYYYRVRSLDSKGNPTVSDEQTFSTSTLPTVSNIVVSGISISGATITWTTNISTNSSLIYGITTSYGSGAGDSTNTATSHSVTLSGLAKGTTYHFMIKSRDVSGNIVIDSDHSFTTSDDDTAPTGSLVINNSVTYANSNTVNLAISATDTGEEGYVYQMKFSNNSTNWSDWETYSGTKSWDVTNATYGGNSNEGSKTVYVKLKDNHSNETTAEISDSITYDATGPSATTPSATTPTNNTKPTWSWTASTDTISGVEGYYIKIGTTSGGSETLAETWIGNNTSYTPTSSLADNTYYLSVKTKDGAGNSGGYNTSDAGVIIDTTAPTTGTISVAAGATYANSATSDLTLSATGATYMRFSNNGTNWSEYEDYSTSKSAWNITSGYGGSSSEGTKNVYVQYKDTAGNESSIYSDSIMYDITAPANGSVTIKDASDSGETYTDNATVALALNAQDGVSGIYQMKFSNNGTTWSNYEAYAVSKSWDITDINYGGVVTDGTKTVYLKFKDNAGNETSATISDAIVLDTSAPSANTPSATSPTNNTKPTWIWTASTDTNGIQGYYIKIGTTQGGSNTLAEIWIGNNISYTPTSTLSDGTYYLSVKAKDNVGNIGSYKTSDTGVVVDTITPSAGSISINNGAMYTNSTTVTLALLATGAVEMNFSNNGTDWNGWEAYGTSKSWTVLGSDGLKTVFAKFIDGAGNESAVYTDTIIYDGTVPGVSLVADSVGASGVTATITWVTNEESTTAVYYGTSAQVNYLNYPYSSTSADYDTNHRRDLASLLTSTKYYYVVRSVDQAGNSTVSEEGDFTTSAFPLVSGVTKGLTTVSAQIISWITNINCDSIVEYGTVSGEYTDSQGDTVESVTSHEVTLTGLSAGTIYYYRVKSRDSAGNIAISSEGTFTTINDVSAPIGSVMINNSALYTNSATVNLAISASDTGAEGVVSQMKFSNNSTSWSDWEAYSGIKSWDITNATYGGTNTNEIKTVYVRLKDNHNNETSTEIIDTIIYDNVAPTANTPSATSPTNNTKPTWSWTTSTDATSGMDGYYIKIGTTSGGSETFAETWIGNNTAYTPNFVLVDNIYYLSIKAKDRAGNSGEYSASSLVTVDTTAPSDGIININSGSEYTNNDIVNLSVFADDVTEMNFSNDGTNWNGWESYTISKTWVLSDPQGIKTVYVKFRDDANNISDISVDTITYDSQSPAISSINASAMTYNSAIILWTTSEVATSQVEYGLDTNYGSSTTLDGDKNIDHRVILSELTAGATYHYRVHSIDNAGNETISGDNNFTTIIYPAISSVSISAISNNSANVSWSTNTSTDSYIEYGTSTDYGAIIGNPDPTTSHSITLSGLLSSTIYHFRVRSTDVYGNIVISDDDVFTTSESATPTISISDPTTTSPQAKDVVTTDITIIWATAVVGSSYVDYGLTLSYGTSVGREEATNSHSVTLTGLQSNTSYHYRARSIDKNGNIFVSSDLTFTTPTLTTPSISAVTLSDVSLTSAVVSWKTSKTASTQVEYATNLDNLAYSTSEDNSPNTTHTVKLDNLVSGATYYFRVKSRDSSTSDLLISNTYSFSTITFPIINNVSISDISETKASINWVTNVKTDAIVEFGATQALGMQQGIEESSVNHKVEIIGLTPSATYYYRVKSRDAYGNLVTSGIASFGTKSDTTGPVIKDIKTETSTVGSGETSRVQVIISWSTDESSTSVVEYGTGLGASDSEGNKSYEKKTNEETTYNQSHIIILSDLKSSTTYHFRVKSIDQSLNASSSQDYTVLTPPKEESMLQIILKSLEDTFGWVGNLKNIFINK